RIDDAVVPQARGGVPGAALVLVLLAHRGLEALLVLGAPLAAAGLDRVAAHGGQHAGGLFAAHHADARVRPHPQEAGAVGAAAHRVVAGAEAAADDHGELGHAGTGHGGDHLRPVLGDAGVLVLAAHHEAGDVLQEHQRDAALVAQLDEMRALERALAEQDAVVGDDAHRAAVHVGEAGDQGLAVARLELAQLAAVDDARDHLADVERAARVLRHQAVELLGRVQRLARLAQRHGRLFAAVEVADDAARDLQRVAVVLGVMVGHAGDG